MKSANVSERITHILNFFLLALLLIVMRVWYLGVVEYEDHLDEAQKPQRRTVIERLERGTIRDRFNLPLALNQIQYNASICYGAIRQIPTVKWFVDEKGKKTRILARRRYIEELSQFLAEALDMEAQDVEDMIHGKASLFPHTPFVLKEDLSEELYFKLKMCERNWAGLQMEQTTKRVYPYGKLACDVIGYMGAIDQREYLTIAREMQELKTFLQERSDGKPSILPKGFSQVVEVEDRLKELKERAYTINAHVGKSGVESAFDERLRGTYGKKVFEVDIMGNPLRELPESKPATPGERLILSISAELQLEAEKILSEYEKLQDERDKTKPTERRTPWQRGGAIVAMDPKTGEVLAMASYPRFDPNDFTPAQTLEKRLEKRPNIIKWLESESYIGDIWDGKQPQEREWYSADDDAFYTEEMYLTWDSYLDTILPKKGPLRQAINRIVTIEDACTAETPDTIPYERDLALFQDLIALLVDKTLFTPTLLEHVKDQTIEEFRAFCQLTAQYTDELKKEARASFHTQEFRQWRDAHFKDFMRERRKEERSKGRYARPYVEYLEIEERKQFAAFWEQNRYRILHHALLQKNDFPELKELLHPMQKEDRIAYLKSLRSFDDLTKPLEGKYPYLRSQNGAQFEKHLAAAFYPYGGFGTARSQAFRQATPQGSIFKLVPAYAGLMQKYREGEEDLNPLTLIDDMQWTRRPGSNSQVLGFLDNGEPIKRFYHGGRLPRAYPKIGKLDVVKAIERTSNIYFSILAGDVLSSPSDLTDAATTFGLGTKTGIDLPGEYRGLLPDDIMHNRTGLYSFAMGQHSLVVTPLQTATMLSAIANGGNLLKPQIVKFSAGVDAAEEGYITFHQPVVREEIDMPEEVQAHLFEGMHLVINGERGTARSSLMRRAFHNREWLANYEKHKSEMIGKTGTAEILYKQTIDAESKADLEKHVWFGTVSFEEDEPELVVAVYLRFGTAGRQGAPMAAQLVEKWREIKTSHH